MSASVEIVVNGTRRRVSAPPDTPLLYVLRDELGLQGPKFGCGLGQCGACTVLLGKDAVHSCVLPLSAAAKAPVTTLEGLGTPEKPHPVQRAFIEEQAAQCAYCINGMIVKTVALLAATPDPTNAEVRRALDGNLCRCGSHMRILRAVHRAAAAAKRAAG